MCRELSPGGARNDRNRQERNSRHRRLLFQLYHAQTFVGFRHDVINHRFHIVRAFPNCDLAVRAGALMQNSLDVVHLAPTSELGYFVGHKLDELVNQTARLRFAFPADIEKSEKNGGSWMYVESVSHA